MKRSLLDIGLYCYEIEYTVRSDRQIQVQKLLLHYSFEDITVIWFICTVNLSTVLIKKNCISIRIISPCFVNQENCYWTYFQKHITVRTWARASAFLFLLVHVLSGEISG